MRSLAALLLLFAAQDRTAVPPPQFGATVQLAMGNDIYGPWQTFVVELDNKSTRDLEARIRIEDDSFDAVATRRERMTAGARKRVFLYSPGGLHQRGLNPRYRITDTDGRDLASGQIPVTLRGYEPAAFQVGIFSRFPTPEDEFGLPTTINGATVHFGRLSASTFPDRWIGLKSLDLLILHDSPLDELTPDQARALSDYVRQGGTLFLTPGATKGWLTHPVLAAFAAIRVDEPRTVSKMGGLNNIYGPFKRDDDAFVLHPILNGVPYSSALGREIARFDAGYGRVYAVGFDLLRSPFDSWTAGRRQLWNDLIAAVPRWHRDDFGFPIAAAPQQRAELLREMARLINPYPSLGLILGLALLFLVAVGPLNYMVLWRARRTILLVVTVPAISIGFLCLILALGYLIKGTSTVAHSARLLSTKPGYEFAREVQLYSVFSPATRTYDITFTPGTFGQSSARWSVWEDRQGGRNESTGTLTCETGPGLTIRGLGVGQWQSWDLEARSIRDLGKGIKYDFDGAKVRVINGSPRFIERGLLVQTGAETLMIPFGAAGPGATVEGTIPAAPVPPLLALGLEPDSLGERLLGGWFVSLHRAGRRDAADERPRRFLVCVLRDDGAPISLDGGISSRSRSLTLLHVGDAP